jgi:hypothetical protein
LLLAKNIKPLDLPPLKLDFKTKSIPSPGPKLQDDKEAYSSAMTCPPSSTNVSTTTPNASETAFDRAELLCQIAGWKDQGKI